MLKAATCASDKMQANTNRKTMDKQELIIYNTEDGKSSVVLIGQEGTVWLSQMQMAELFATSKQSISYHIANILKERELPKQAVVKEILTTAADGKQYKVVHYSLDMVLAVGYRIKGVRGTQFRQWATRHLSEYLTKDENPMMLPKQTDWICKNLKNWNKLSNASSLHLQPVTICNHFIPLFMQSVFQGS